MSGIEIPYAAMVKFRGVIDRRSGDFIRFTRTARGATEAPEEVVAPDRAAEEEGEVWTTARDEVDLLGTMGLDHDDELFLGGELSPTFFGSALTNFGVRLLLDAVIDLAPAATARRAACT